MFRRVKRRTDGRKNFDSHETSFDDSISSNVDGNTSFESGRIHSGKGFNNDLSIYPHRLSFYKMAPFEEITLEEFETWAIDRLKVLLEIESCNARGKNMRDTEAILKPILNKYLPLNLPSRESTSLYLERKKDHYSHFILRLAFCRSEELRIRFIKAETTLFRIRYDQLSIAEQKAFVNSIDLPWELVTSVEKEKFKEQLFATSFNSIKNILTNTVEYQRMKRVSDEQIQAYFDKEPFLKVPFEYVPELVSTRQAFVNRGYAYIAQFSQLSLISQEYSKYLNEQLTLTMRALPTLDEDDRLVPVLNNLSKGYVSIDYNEFGFGDGNDSESKDLINAENVTSREVLKDMPMCMSTLMTGLNMDSHLKYAGRNQLSLFLKGIGLSAEEALKFWQYQFTKNNSSITIEKFNKEYKYNFRHNYGLEGGRINYKPWDCKTILSKPKPKKDEYHGCPYRDLHRDELSIKLKKMGLKDDRDLLDIIDISERGEYQNACTKVFEIINKKEIDACIKSGSSIDQSSIIHPNQYFDKARQLDKSTLKVESH